MNLEKTSGELTPPGIDAAAATRRLRRRRARTWLAFGLVGLMMGAVWAVGIATSTATVDTGGAAPATQVFGTAAGASSTSQYAGLVSANTPLTIGFRGRWGRVAADTPMFDVDLTAEAGTYFVEVNLNNNPAGWSALQLEFHIVNTTCALADSADWASPAASSVMAIESEDASAVFASLASGTAYCIGIEAITPKANDTAGTYIRRPSGSATPDAPVFAALLGRSA